MLQLSGEKMSKSIGNLVTIEEFLANHPAEALRMMVLNSGYRNPLSYSEEILDQAEKAIERLRSALKPALPGASGLAPAGIADLAKQVEKTRAGFITAMDNDFNSSGALAELFELVRATNLARADGAADAQLEPAQAALRELASVLGLKLDTTKVVSTKTDEIIDLLIEIRKELRANKLWALSDTVRDRLAVLGVILEDSKEGTSWHWK
jgi:cysteinyl-tRNA synthetase